MSYILDALQRADAERERGQVPGLRSRAAPFVADSRPRRSSRVWWPALAIGLTGLLLLAWWLWSTSSTAPTRDVASAPELAPAPAATPVPAAQAPATGGPVAASASGDPAVSGPALPILAPAVPAAAPAAPAKQAPQAAANTRTGSAPSPATATETAAAAQPAVAPAAQEARVPSYGELSADVRARLPQVSVSGATYSANPAHRMLIVNGQVLQEGQEIQSGLRLVSIGPRSATLEHQGLRYTIGY